MRTAVCSFAALLSFTAAGFGQASAKPEAVFAPSRFAHVKLLESLQVAGQRAPKAGTVVQRRLSRATGTWAIPWSTSRRVVQPRVFQAPATCGHIGVVPVSPDTDSEFILPVPLSRNDRMPKIKGMPPCNEALR